MLNTDNLHKVLKNEKYWLFRAGKGAKYFDLFYSTGKIAMAWDRIDEKAQMRNKEILEKEVRRLYPDEKAPWNVYNKIHRFYSEMKVGDLIVMPDTEKRRVAVGRILDEEADVQKVIEQKTIFPIGSDMAKDTTDPGCLNKFRRIEWLKLVDKKEVSSNLLAHLFCPQTISLLSNDVKYEVNKLIYDVFILDNKLHIKYKIETESDVYARDMKNFFSLIDYAEKVINIVDENEERVATKTSVNSPGTITIIATVSVATLAILTHVLNGGSMDVNLWGLKLKTKGGKTLHDYLEQRHRHKLEILDRALNRELPLVERQKLIKNLDIKPPKIDD